MPVTLGPELCIQTARGESLHMGTIAPEALRALDTLDATRAAERLEGQRGSWLNAVEWILSLDQGRPVGLLQLEEGQLNSREIHIDIFDPDDRGRGLGTAALRAATSVAFAPEGGVNVAFLRARAAPANLPSLAALKRAGFYEALVDWGGPVYDMKEQVSPYERQWNNVWSQRPTRHVPPAEVLEARRSASLALLRDTAAIMHFCGEAGCSQGRALQLW